MPDCARVTVREAGTDDLTGAVGVLQAALLDVSAERVGAAIDRGDALVAVGDAVVGALVVEDGAVAAVAVRPGRRSRGVGTALVESALDRHGELVAEFDPRVRPFWESLCFAVQPAGEEGRLRGRRG